MGVRETVAWDDEEDEKVISKFQGNAAKFSGLQLEETKHTMPANITDLVFQGKVPPEEVALRRGNKSKSRKGAISADRVSNTTITYYDAQN